MVEYTLMLVIIVGLVLAMKKGFSNLNASMNKYIGDYIKCLMQYGELPTLGSSNSDINKHTASAGMGKVCEAKFEGFTFTNGAPSTTTGGTGGTSGGTSGSGGTGSGSSGSGKNGSNSSSNSKDSSSNAKNASSSDSDSSSSSRSNRNGSGGSSEKSSSSAYGRGDIKRSSDRFGTNDNGSSSLSGAEAKSKIIDDDEDSAGSGKKGRRNSRRGRYTGNRYVYNNDKYRAIAGEELQRYEKSLPRSTRKPTSERILIPKDAEGMSFGPSVRTFVPPEKKKDLTVENQDSGFSFGYMLRWLIIAGIVVAIVIFFGGQVMNYSNSQD